MAFSSSNKHLIFIVVVSFFEYISGQETCLNLNTDGYTVPRGDITLRYGQPLSITCNLHKKVVERCGQNASSLLNFKRNNDIIPDQMVEVLNSTSIRLYIQNHPKTSGDNYYCYFNHTFVCMNVVVVAVPPQEVTDFSCISKNYDNLTCTWTPPENYIRTDYNLTYFLKSRPSRLFSYNCTNLRRLENGQYQCFWDVSTTPQYRQVHEVYQFLISANNTFGSKRSHFVFEHFKRVIPNPPENLTAIATSPHSIRLSWVIPSSMVSFKPGLQHRILYQCQYYKKKVWRFGDIIPKTNGLKDRMVTYELHGLKYAHALCDIRVSMRSAKADPLDESMWSENATRTVRTLSKIPDCPPQTNIGSFNVLNDGDTRDVYIYWKELDDSQRNGQNFSYIVEINNYQLKPVFTKLYAFFKKLSSAVDYTINIWSENEKGRSAEKSTVFVPAKRLDGPMNFFMVAHRDNLFELKWDPPKNSEALVTNYTIFWCRSDGYTSYRCAGDFNWTTVSSDVRKYNLTLTENNIYQFALSANSYNSSSGMTWTECPIVPNESVGQIKYITRSNVESDFIDIEWNLDCSNHRDSIKGFVIYYCPIGPSRDSCNRTTEKNVTIHGDVNTKSGRVNGLKPYTSYRITVSYILEGNKYSQISKPLYATSMEAAPTTPPLDVEIYNVTNSSISLRWQPPAEMNGMLRKYVVYYNDNRLDTRDTQITLSNLMSFVNYSITLQACTIFCSNRSDPISVTTRMWLPGVVSKPLTAVEKDNRKVIVWGAPQPPRGRTDYYQIKMAESNDANESKVHLVNVTSQNYTIENCASGKHQSLFVAIRAVNIIDGEHKAGPWSDTSEFSCLPNPILYVVVGVCTLCAVLFLLWVLRRGYVWWNGLEPIVPKLPPGLEAEIWDTEKSRDIERNPPGDDQLLLQKLTETRISADSSGCSSGHDSIASSMDSTTHISPSDSGTEQPRSPTLSEDHRKNSLRQRNVSNPRPAVNTGYVPTDTVPLANWNAKTAPPTIGNYSVIGGDPSNPTRLEPVYELIREANLPFDYDVGKPPPYVVTGDLGKPVVSGYVPYPSTEPAGKNTGYILPSGITNDLLITDLVQCDAQKPMTGEEKPHYIRAGDPIPGMMGAFPWQQPPTQSSLPKVGYVSVGDVAAPKSILEVPLKAVSEAAPISMKDSSKSLLEAPKGYVPHRQFEAKALKED